MLYALLNLLRDWLDANNLYGYVRVLDQIQFRALAAAGLAFAIVIVFGRPTIAWLRRKKIGDAGLTDAEALRTAANSKANTPTMGGLLICAAIAGATIMLADLSQFYIKLGLIVLVWLAALGGFDDWLKLTAKSRGTGSRQGLYAWEKLVFQLGLGVIVGYFVFSHGTGPDGAPTLGVVLNLPFQKTYESLGVPASNLIYLSKVEFIVLSALMITGLSNAVNLTDGMDGLAAGISTAVSLGLFVLALVAGWQAAAQYLLVPYIPGSDELAVLAGAMAGACLGFMWWNCFPAQVFMGDTGSLALGGLMAYIGIVIRHEAVLLLMCGMFLVEIGSVVLQVGCYKITKGKRRIFRVAPIHHHYHLGGWTEQQVVARFWIISIILVVLALASIKVR